MKLLIAIPALNEEKSLQKVIERTLAARKQIMTECGLSDIDITVISDGSTDRTTAIAKSYRDKIKLITFRKNRGYGAAIKEAWYRSDADLLAFMDADGTCDPRFFSNLCQVLEREKADIALGSRLNAKSKMPWLRRVGNAIFACLLMAFSSKAVRDVASGMRVVRRRCLSKLMPLPDGLQFTPAMSAQAILSGELKVIEIPMPYHERDGQSKLHVAKDGIRFLEVIIEAAFLYRPARLLTFAGLACLAVTTALMITPFLDYLTHRTVEEWMIYRFVVSNLLGASGCLLLSASYLSQKIVEMTVSRPIRGRRSRDILELFFSSYFSWLIPGACIVAGSILVLPSFIELVQSGATYEHWSRFIAMSFLFSVATILIVTKSVNHSLNLIKARLRYMRKKPPRFMS